MSTWINILQRIVEAITVSIQTLRIQWIGHNSIGRDKPADVSVIITGIIEVEPGLIQPLAGEEFIGAGVSILEPGSTKWEVFDGAVKSTIAVRRAIAF